MPRQMRLAIVGGGWAGLAAAVDACEAGHQVSVFEMAHHCGGRARSVTAGEHTLDNGQHILIGAYTQTLALMRRVGVDAALVLSRWPMSLVDAHGQGLSLPPGPALLSFTRGVLAHQGWRLRDRLALMLAAGSWLMRGFRCADTLTVSQLTRHLPKAVMNGLIEPLCVAALNTPAHEASARVFLRVLRDALFSGQGSADLLLPMHPLGKLLPEPAARWIKARGGEVHEGQRVMALRREGAQWCVTRTGGESCFDAVVLACTASEAARLTDRIAPAWSAQAASFAYEPIITVYLQSPGSRWSRPTLTLPGHADTAPAQFAFDLGACGGIPGLFAFVISGARHWVERGLEATAAATLTQAQALPATLWQNAPQVVHTWAEKRATFRCTPELVRPRQDVAPQLYAAGDYIDGPYPATLEGAVRSGLQAVQALR